jgi:hypothetical protein
MTTPAGLTRYRRSCPTKFAGTCVFCEHPTVVGADFAAQTDKGKWLAVCATCAASVTAQVSGIVGTLAADIQAHADVPCDLSSVDNTVLAAVSAGTAQPAEAYSLLLALGKVRLAYRASFAAAAPAAPAAAPTLPPNAYPGRCTKCGTFVEAQQGLRARVNGKWTVQHVTCPEGEQRAPRAEVAPGLYRQDDGEVFKLYTTQNGRLFGKVLEVYVTVDSFGKPHSHGSFEGQRGIVRKVAEGVAKGTTRLLTEDEAKAFGRQHSLCICCTRDLDDDRSLAAGYGPVCAANMGWSYPTYAQAAEILQRPVTSTAGKVYEPTTA